MKTVEGNQIIAADYRKKKEPEVASAITKYKTIENLQQEISKTRIEAKKLLNKSKIKKQPNNNVDNMLTKISVLEMAIEKLDKN